MSLKFLVLTTDHQRVPSYKYAKFIVYKYYTQVKFHICVLFKVSQAYFPIFIFHPLFRQSFIDFIDISLAAVAVMLECTWPKGFAVMDSIL